MDTPSEARGSPDSQLLHGLCCDVGFDELTWRRRIRNIDIKNTCVSYGSLSRPTFNANYLYSGSASEGVATAILGSDLDIMIVVAGTRVVQGKKTCSDKLCTLFRTVPSPHDAFVVLKLVRIADELDRDRNILPFCVADKTGDMVLGARAFTEGVLIRGPEVSQPTIHGPAQTVTLNLQCEKESDYVMSLHCTTWPDTALNWTQRQRSFNWPSPCLVRDISNMGCELVPVGNPLSSNRDMEWRFSTSRAEKLLIRTCNVTQIQCFFLLKLVLAYLIKPQAPDSLCTYHLKIILLHTLENTDPTEWQTESLTNCFMTCLQTLLQFLQAGYLPHAFIETQNLLAPKLQGHTRQRIIEIVSNLHSEGWTCVLRCAPLMGTTIDCSHSVPRCPCHIRQWKMRSFVDAANDAYFALAAIERNCNEIVHFCTTSDFVKTVESLLDIISFDDTSQAIYYPSECVAQIVRKILTCHVGLMLLNSLNPKYRLPKGNSKVYFILKTAQRFLEENCDVDMTSCRLKLATFYFHVGKVRRCIQTVHKLLARRKEGEVLYVCADNYRTVRFRDHEGTRTALKRLYPLFDDFACLLKHTEFPVTFSPWELRCAPDAVQKLIFTRHVTTPRDHTNYSLLHIDSVVYAHYLLHVSYLDLGRNAAALQSLIDMRRVVEDQRKHITYYPDTCLQLLGIVERSLFQRISDGVQVLKAKKCSS